MDKRFKGTEEEYIEFRKKRNEANRRYYSKPSVRKKKKIYAKKYRIENREKISEYGKKHNLKPEVKQRIRKWREENREHLKEYSRSPKRKLSKSISDKKYREKRKKKEGKFWMDKKTRERQKKWYEENRERLKEVRRKYYQTKRGRLSVAVCNHRKLALNKERPTDLNAKRIKMIKERDKVCVYCGEKENLELDHVVPLKLGGTSLSNNFVLACIKCNRSKHGREVTYWCKLQGIDIPKIVLELLELQKVKAFKS